MQAPARKAPASTGLLIPRLHADVPREFGGELERVAIEELKRIGALKGDEVAESIESLLYKGVGNAIGFEHPPLHSCLVGERLEDAPVSFGFSAWGMDGRIVLGDIMQVVADATDLVTSIAVGRYLTGILNAHPLICGPDAWKDHEQGYEQHLADSDPKLSPTKQSHIATDAEFFTDMDALAALRRILPEAAECAETLAQFTSKSDAEQLLQDFTDYYAGGWEPYALVGWSHEPCHLDHCIDAMQGSIEDGGERYETIACTLTADQLKDLGELCDQLNAIENLATLSWNLKPKETASFLTRLCSATVDTPGQLLLSTESAAG